MTGFFCQKDQKAELVVTGVIAPGRAGAVLAYPHGPPGSPGDLLGKIIVWVATAAAAASHNREIAAISIDPASLPRKRKSEGGITTPASGAAFFGAGASGGGLRSPRDRKMRPHWPAP